MSNWRTTLAGLLGSVLMVLSSPSPTKPNIQTIVSAAAVAAVGTLAGDGKNTNGPGSQGNLYGH